MDDETLGQVAVGHLAGEGGPDETVHEPFAFQPEHDGTLPLRTAVFQALGAASVCWDPMPVGCVFDSTRAEAIGEALMALLGEHMDGWRPASEDERAHALRLGSLPVRITYPNGVGAMGAVVEVKRGDV